TVRSAIDLPSFDNSAMDGYAVRSADTRGASLETPVRLGQCAKIPAGGAFSGELKPGDCARLFTGSPMPSGADAVVMQEDTRVEPSTPEIVHVLDVVKPFENVRLQGSDVKRGTVIAAEGQRLTTTGLALLAATGVGSVSVGRQPVTGLLATGSELREAAATLVAGEIYESNRVVLSSLIKQSGAQPRVYPLVPDTSSDTRRSLEQAFAECDIVVTCGGVSVGEFDFVKTAFEAIGGRLDFWKVSMRPGKPFVFGRLGETFLFGLPGNPVSAFVTFLLLARPALLHWQGATDNSLPSAPGVLTETLTNPGDRRHFARVRMDVSGRVRLAGLQVSHALGSLAVANGLVDVPPRCEMTEGTTVKVLRWD
ncbi:MAG TPA: molybdopterin molybdotransferase MoeA, partial [Verrucomicrobiota bacterium]|nr:molybdopterin molybdotransferase MoeA [Verrucomicrobiota bacterium]